MGRRRPLIVGEVDKLATHDFVLGPVLRLASAGAVPGILATAAGVGGGAVTVDTAIADFDVLRAREGGDELLEDALELVLDQLRGRAFCESLLVRTAHGGTDGFVGLASWGRCV